MRGTPLAATKILTEERSLRIRTTSKGTFAAIVDALYHARQSQARHVLARYHGLLEQAEHKIFIQRDVQSGEARKRANETPFRPSRRWSCKSGWMDRP